LSVTSAVGTNEPGFGGFQVDVPLILGGANLQASADAGAAALVDGQLSVVSTSVTSAVLVYKSGNTVYTFVNATAE